MVNLFPYFWKRIIITGVWPDENEKLNIKKYIDLWLKQLISAN